MITLGKTVKVDVVKPQSIETDTVSVDSITDSRSSKTVTAKVRIGEGPSPVGRIIEVILWEGKEYDSIGQWTDEQADEQLKSILTA